MLPTSNSAIHDVTGFVDFSRPAEVARSVNALLEPRYARDWDAALLRRVVADVARAYAGGYPGLLTCDTPYHDLRHVLDTALVTARLIDGYERFGANPALGGRYAMLAVILALLHDIGLLRRVGEEGQSGAAFTSQHEARGACFAGQYLAGTSLADLAPLAALIDATRLTCTLEEFPRDERERIVARFLGTADLISQISDRHYLEKCRDFLFAEFLEAGLAKGTDGKNPVAIYASPEDLLRQTPQFYERLIAARLETELGGVHNLLTNHFGPEDPYHEAIAGNLGYLHRLLQTGDFSRLRRRPQALYGEKSPPR